MNIKNVLILLSYAVATLTVQAQMNLPRTVVDSNEYYYYVAGDNESIYDIAAKLGVTKDFIIQNNPDAADGITSGMSLFFPVSDQGKAVAKKGSGNKLSGTHRRAGRDTLWSGQALWRNRRRFHRH